MIVLLLKMNGEHTELINIAARVLGDFSHYDELSIYEQKDQFEIITTSFKKRYVTRTYIGKYRWRVLRAYYKKFEEDEVELYLRKTKT